MLACAYSLCMLAGLTEAGSGPLRKVQGLGSSAAHCYQQQSHFAKTCLETLLSAVSEVTGDSPPFLSCPPSANLGKGEESHWTLKQSLKSLNAEASLLDSLLLRSHQGAGFDSNGIYFPTCFLSENPDAKKGKAVQRWPRHPSRPSPCLFHLGLTREEEVIND